MATMIFQLRGDSVRADVRFQLDDVVRFVVLAGVFVVLVYVGIVAGVDMLGHLQVVE